MGLEGTPTYYFITVGAQLDQRWSTWFDGLAITSGADGETTLTGPVLDQAALHGLLARIRDLGLPLISVVPGPAPSTDGVGNGSLSDGSSALDGKATSQDQSPRSRM